MKSMIRILALAAALAVVGFVAAPAEASCSGSVIVQSFGAGGYSELIFPAGTTATDIVGHFWVTGNRAAINEGTSKIVASTQADVEGFVRFDPAFNSWYIFGNLSAPGIVGCPSPTDNLTFFIGAKTNNGAFFHVRTAAKNVTGDYDMSAGGNINLVPLPRASVQSSARAGTSVNLQLLAQAPPAAGFSGITVPKGFQYVSAAGNADPGRDGAAYEAGGTLTPGSPSPASVNCSNLTQDRFVATQLVVDGFPISRLVSPASRVECDPSLADPKFKHIDRPARPNPRGER
jgi:hypothetical protein